MEGLGHAFQTRLAAAHNASITACGAGAGGDVCAGEVAAFADAAQWQGLVVAVRTGKPFLTPMPVPLGPPI